MIWWNPFEFSQALGRRAVRFAPTERGGYSDKFFFDPFDGAPAKAGRLAGGGREWRMENRG
jgi:hypothetical protein